MLRFFAYVGLFLVVALPMNFHFIWFGHFAQTNLTFKPSWKLAVESGTLLITTVILIIEIIFASKNSRLAPVKGLDSIFYLALILFFAWAILILPVGATFGNGQILFNFTDVTLKCQSILFMIALTAAIFINFFVHKEQS